MADKDNRKENINTQKHYTQQKLVDRSNIIYHVCFFYSQSFILFYYIMFYCQLYLLPTVN